MTKCVWVAGFEQRGSWHQQDNWDLGICPEEGDEVDINRGWINLVCDDPSMVDITFMNGTLDISNARVDQVRGCKVHGTVEVIFAEGTAGIQVILDTCECEV